MNWEIETSLIGRSAIFQQTLSTLERFAACDATTLIYGETGTGKELAARAIHYLSRRRDEAFIPVNCGAIPDTLLESELFGFVKGAFTDARNPRRGLVRQAQGGTLFLDEIEALSARGQVMLLRFLQDRIVRPLGTDQAEQVDVRVVAASNVDLETQARQGGFRHDLLFRLMVLAVRLPSLQERQEDIPLLCDFFLKRFASEHETPLKKLHPATLDQLLARHWNGNVRELENTLLRAFLLSEGPTILPEALHNICFVQQATAPETHEQSFRKAKASAIATFEQQFVRRMLAAAGGNIAEAARLCGKERSALSRLVHKYSLHKPKDEPQAS